jgi:hypothetical protein
LGAAVKVSDKLTLFDELFADPVHPLPAADIAGRVAVAENALLVLYSGSGPSWFHWNICALVVGFMDAFISHGCAEDPDGLLQDAHAALMQARSRARASNTQPTLNATETGVLLALVTDFGECLSGTSARSAIKAMRATEKAARGFLHHGP